MRKSLIKFIKLAFPAEIKTLGDKVLAYLSEGLFVGKQPSDVKVTDRIVYLHRVLYSTKLVSVEDMKELDFEALSNYLNGKNLMIKSEITDAKGVITRGVTRIEVVSLDGNRIKLAPSLYSNNLTERETEDSMDWLDQQSGSDHTYESPSNWYSDDMFRGDYSPIGDTSDFYSDWTELPSQDHLLG